MNYLEIGQLLAQLGLVPALGIALVVLWRKWWSMVDALVTKYEGVIKKKDEQIAELTAKVDSLGEQRLEELRTVITDYRNTLDETNRRDEKLAVATQANQRLLEQLLNTRGGTP